MEATRHSETTAKPTASIAQGVYVSLYGLYQKLYFAFGRAGGERFGDVLPTLFKIAEKVSERG